MFLRLLFAIFVWLQALQAFGAYTVVIGPNLLSWHIYSAEISPPASPYNRLKHFGVWVTDLLGSSCQNTRNQILVRDSAKEVEYLDRRQCFVETGVWEDPYTNRLFTKADHLQVDHVVPLKNAYDMGAWTWGNNRRCLFANYMGNDFHLRAVSAIENMIKQAAGPESYIPPNSRHVCQYLKEWLKIKLIWNLKMTMPEANSIRTHIQDYRCNPQDFKVTQAFVNQQRALIQKQQGKCQI